MVLLTGACTAEPPVSSPVTTTPWKPPTLVNEQVPYEGVLHVVRDVVDGRTVELVDGRRVQIAQVAAPVGCQAEPALTFARTTLLAGTVRISPVRSGDVRLELEDGTDYAVLAVRQGVLKVEGVDGGPLLTAESEAAAAGRGVWGPGCDIPGSGNATSGQSVPGPTAPGRTSAAPAPPTVRPPAPTTAVPPARTCAVSYRVTGQWPDGFQANVSVRNTGTAPVDGWTLRWSFANGQVVTEMWNARARQSGAVVSALNADYNPRIAPGGEVVIGFNGSARSGNAAPGSFTLNGQACSAG
ncbi:cellulose-binding domain-containing protein [Lentzea sp. NBRC 102530]|uniref:cellulose-binding domain-containing protein n=1 Tax=Lentzea sp. NBRC 102530 TaxID=3032201 RepID=UPI0025548FA7|nr:cellulose-binding domain-containing protein [Lentzea sp. NBRC 102530]